MSKKSPLSSAKENVAMSAAFVRAGRKRSTVRQKLSLYVKDYNARARAAQRAALTA